MHLSHTEEQEALRDAVAGFLDKASDPESVREAEPVVEQRRPVADGHRQVPGCQVQRFTGVFGHLPRAPADDAARGGLGPVRHPLSSPGPTGQQVTQPVGVVGDDVERDEVQPVLRSRRDAGLSLPPKGDDPRIGPGPATPGGR